MLCKYLLLQIYYSIVKPYRILYVAPKLVLELAVDELLCHNEANTPNLH